MSTLTCDSCPETADGVKAAITHITANYGHTMSGPTDEEGTTVTVGVAMPDDFYENDDEFDFDEDDDWADQ